MVSGSYGGDPRPFTPSLVQHFRDLLAIHADDPVLGACLLCKEIRCRDWRYAWAQLAAAGELTAADTSDPASTSAAQSPARHPASVVEVPL
jgi:hypothetical protein